MVVTSYEFHEPLRNSVKNSVEAFMFESSGSLAIQSPFPRAALSSMLPPAAATEVRHSEGASQTQPDASSRDFTSALPNYKSTAKRKHRNRQVNQASVGDCSHGNPHTGESGAA